MAEASQGPDLVVVRPYADRIRMRVFEVLGAAGVSTDDALIIPPQTSDARAYGILARIVPRVLLAPFHAHRDESGRDVNGLSFVLGLQTAGELLGRTLVVMPVSKMGRAAAVLKLRELDGATGAAADLARRALVVHEDELGDPSLVLRLRASLRALR